MGLVQVPADGPKGEMGERLSWRWPAPPVTGSAATAASTGAERAGDLGIVVLGSAVFVRVSSAARNAVVKPALPNSLSPARVATSRSCGAPVRETGASTIPFTARSRTLRLLLSRPTM